MSMTNMSGPKYTFVYSDLHLDEYKHMQLTDGMTWLDAYDNTYSHILTHRRIV